VTVDGRGDAPRDMSRPEDLIRASICDKYPGSMKLTTHLDHISHCETSSGTNGPNRWTTWWMSMDVVMPQEMCRVQKMGGIIGRCSTHTHTHTYVYIYIYIYISISIYLYIYIYLYLYLFLYIYILGNLVNVDGGRDAPRNVSGPEDGRHHRPLEEVPGRLHDVLHHLLRVVHLGRSTCHAISGRGD